MSEFRDLVIAISVLVPALASAFVLVWNTVRSGGRKPEQVARSAAEEAAATVLEAVADGELSKEDLDAIDRALRRTREDGGSA